VRERDQVDTDDLVAAGAGRSDGEVEEGMTATGAEGPEQTAGRRGVQQGAQAGADAGAEGIAEDEAQGWFGAGTPSRACSALDASAHPATQPPAWPSTLCCTLISPSHGRFSLWAVLSGMGGWFTGNERPPSTPEDEALAATASTRASCR
jgi:hypothetical protein